MEYMSQEGFDKLNGELQQLIKETLPKAIQAISDARDKGDLSENFEYHAAKREQGRVLRRISFLQNVLSNARVLPSDSVVDGRVQLLSKVELLNVATNKRMSFTIVSPHEASAAEAKISIKSPMAHAILNHKKGEEVDVSVPMGVMRLRILDISR